MEQLAALGKSDGLVWVVGCLTKLQSVDRIAAIQVGQQHSRRSRQPGFDPHERSAVLISLPQYCRSACYAGRMLVSA